MSNGRPCRRSLLCCSPLPEHVRRSLGVGRWRFEVLEAPKAPRAAEATAEAMEAIASALLADARHWTGASPRLIAVAIASVAFFFFVVHLDWERPLSHTWLLGIVDTVLLSLAVIDEIDGALAVTYGPLVVANHARCGYLTTPVVFGVFPAVVGSPYFLRVVPAVKIMSATTPKPAAAGGI
ncbi:hypothetical protein Taro_009411 [Colocasia esculenta]|uniref:Uncharacterized protein n=1 Tax=Colocasia esculenta TaxID=4460 RepID=A0A843U5M9_COLES|nr:hypothetical protein [Colocasia esculenta]